MSRKPEPEPTLDQSWCEVGGRHDRCTGYTQDEADPETCFCDCHDNIEGNNSA